MGTSFSIKATVLPKGLENEILKQQINAELRSLNAIFSTYDVDSELSKINTSTANEWHDISFELQHVLSAAEAISKQTAGAFDVTVGPLVNLWGFGPGPEDAGIPNKDKIQRILNHTGYKLIQIKNNAPWGLKKLHEKLYIDLSAIAKGYAVDKIAILLEKQGIVNYLVEIGGELRLKGRNIEKQAWKIAIEKPSPEIRTVHKIMAVSDTAIATSGDYRNFFEKNGRRYSHTIDPRTGRPVNHKLASVTVFAATAMVADAWATAFMVLGADQGIQLAEQYAIAATFIIKTNDGFTELSSSKITEILR